VTLNITIVAPWGVWQCSDHRVTWLRRGRPIKTDDLSVKHLGVRCRDGSALITYTGLGAVDLAKPDVHISDWMRRLLRGDNQTVDETLIRIRKAATAELAGPAATAGVNHTFVVGACLQRRPWVAVISNVRPPLGSPPPLHRFETGAIQADEPRLLVTGDGQRAVSEDDRVLLRRVTERRPSRPQDYSQLLAEIHRRAKHSNHPARHTISEGCMTTFMPPSGYPLQGKVHWYDSDQSAGIPRPMPLMVFGIDISEMAKVLIENLRAKEAGEPVDEDEFQRLVSEAGRRAVEPRFP
jgi:hypothetical protein